MSEAVEVPSVAVTLTEIGPVKAAGGVPVKVWVAALNFSHVGSAVPLASVAL